MGIVTTGVARAWRIAPLDLQEQRQDTGNSSFGLALLIRKPDTKTIQEILKELDRLKESCAHWGWDSRAISVPFLDGERIQDKDPFKKEANGHMVLYTWSERPPEPVDQKLCPAGSYDEIDGGCKVRAGLNFFPIYGRRKARIACRIVTIQIISKGE